MCYAIIQSTMYSLIQALIFVPEYGDTVLVHSSYMYFYHIALVFVLECVKHMQVHSSMGDPSQGKSMVVAAVIVWFLTAQHF